MKVVTGNGAFRIELCPESVPELQKKNEKLKIDGTQILVEDGMYIQTRGRDFRILRFGDFLGFNIPEDQIVSISDLKSGRQVWPAAE